MRRYITKDHECSHCGILITPEAFKYHSEAECFMIEMKNKQLKDEIERSDDGQKRSG